MQKALVVHSSPRQQASSSRKLAQAVLERLQKQSPQMQIQVRDLAQKITPHLEESHLAAFFAPADQRTPEHQQSIAHSDEIIREVMDADVLVVSLPMWNFSIPSALKAWIDHLVRAGVTFRYGPKGPEGLIIGKKVYLVIASGGIYTQGPAQSVDFTENYLRAVLGFLGMKDLSVFRVEGTSLPERATTALDQAIAAIHL